MGAVQERVKDVEEVIDFLRPVGALGAANGVTAFDALEAAPVPDTFVALTLKVKLVPGANPVKVHERPAVAVQLAGGVTTGAEVTE